MLKYSMRTSKLIIRSRSCIARDGSARSRSRALTTTSTATATRSSTHETYNKTHELPSNLFTTAIVTAFALVGGLACASSSSSTSSSSSALASNFGIDSSNHSNWLLAHCDSEYYSVAEVGRIMREKLQSGREKLRKQGRPIPRITVRAINFPGRNGRETETQVMDMSFDQVTVKSITALLSHWLDAMDDADAKTPASAVTKKREIMQTFKDFYANKKQLTLPIVSADKSSSMTISKFIGPSDYDRQDQTQRVSISIFKDTGFSMKHIESIVKGYEEGFDVNNTIGNSKNKKGSASSRDEDQGLVFGMDQDISDAIDAQNKLKSVLEKYFSSSFGSGGDGTDDEHSGTLFGRGPAGGSDKHSVKSGETATTMGNPSSAIEGLRSMGVEVFDKESNEKFTWDYLAGYDHIKQEIEDTVVNALKHPEIYDDIAKQTRLHYESNRPKAVLLEGPPGTGKTLTARILASEVEAPLVIIKLESIVSKWYGDSEKKLSKILDYCDQLQNTIIFVDEIDALTQSRDSENGIHEVSKRILSILLQRLEGFHGKSKSLLICTTNRKQDLDRALISRFDLVIPYDLPDLKTRMEIFRRYAKQLQSATGTSATNASTNTASAGATEGQNNANVETVSKNPYEMLGKVSEGLSCRDLKEICEYAERKCASRLVKFKIQQEETQAKQKNGSTTLPDSQQKGSSATSSGNWWSILPGSVNKKVEELTAPPALPTLDDYLESVRCRNMERHSLADKYGNRPEPFSSV